jgi:hypothetical protein
MCSDGVCRPDAGRTTIVTVVPEPPPEGLAEAAVLAVLWLLWTAYPEFSSSPRDRPRARTTADENSGDAVREGRCAGRRASCVSVRARGTRPV